MSVVGLWNEQEIRASYTLSDGAILVGVISIFTFGIGVGIWGGNRRRQLLLAWGATVLFASAYVGLVQQLSSALCIDAPLDVKVHGILNAPFFLGTKGAGLLILIVLFAATNILALKIHREVADRVLQVMMLNAGLLFILSAVALAAYVAVGFGIGLPLE